jgi:hypothetical protein
MHLDFRLLSQLSDSLAGVIHCILKLTARVVNHAHASPILGAPCYIRASNLDNDAVIPPIINPSALLQISSSQFLQNSFITTVYTPCLVHRPPQFETKISQEKFGKEVG